MQSITTLFRNAYGGLSREVWLLALAQLINRSGTMVLVFLAVYLQEELQFTIAKAGVVMALFGAGSFLGVFISGRLTDKLGYYPILIFSLMSGGIMFLVVSFFSGYTSLCAGMFLISALGDGFRPANMAAISYYSTPETYTRAVSLNRLAINLGFAIGPALGGIFATINYRALFWADGLSCIGAAFLIFFLLENKFHKSRKQENTAEKKIVASPYRDKMYMLFLPIAALYALAFFQFFTTMPLYYKNIEHLSETQIGWAMALNGILVATVEMIMIYKIESRWTKYNFIALGAAMVALSYLMLLFVGGYAWILVIIVVISFSEMFAMPFMNAFMNSRAAPSNIGQYASLYNMAWSAAQISIPIVATQTITHFGYDALWILLGGISMVIVVGIKYLEKQMAKSLPDVPLQSTGVDGENF